MTNEDNNKVTNKNNKVYGYDKEVREKYFVLLSLKEEWKKAESRMLVRIFISLPGCTVFRITCWCRSCSIPNSKWHAGTLPLFGPWC